MKLKISKITQMLAALNALSGGRQRIIETNGIATGQAFEPYAFPAQTKLNIIRNVAILRPFAETFQEAVKGLVKEISPDGKNETIDSDPVLLKKYRDRLDELQEGSFPVKGLLCLNWETLDTAKVDTNTIANLGVIVRGIPAPDDKDLVPDPEDQASDTK